MNLLISLLVFPKFRSAERKANRSSGLAARRTDRGRGCLLCCSAQYGRREAPRSKKGKRYDQDDPRETPIARGRNPPVVGGRHAGVSQSPAAPRRERAPHAIRRR